MAAHASTINAQFLVNTGDNFYWCGIQNTSDFQVATDWLNPYNDASLDIPWYGVLGNHEYGYNVSAQIDLSTLHPNWIMDDHYYTKRITVTDSVHISMVFIDTSPCVSEYRSSSSSGWDPCGSQYPTCSLTNDPSDDFEGPCKFHENIISQDCSTQFTWFKEQLSSIPSDDWVIVVGHHPIDECDVEDLTSALQDHGFDLYLNGHAHTLTQYTVDGTGAYVTTGAGSLVNTADQLGGTAARNLTKAKVEGAAHLDTNYGHSYKTIWNQKVAGFTAHSFNDDYTQLTTDYIDYSGNVVHSFTVTKGSSPSPSPSPSPTGSCCHYSDSSCNEGDVCCKSNCDDPSTCSYTEYGCTGSYGQVHNCQWDGSTCKVGPQRNEL
uniref:Calcineurin-like phosphoesterase domain-containing protein n=1 Tax=Lotharella oceanica TaxID=641309 RepID=A0A7S2XDA4_9EUKA